jgi:PhnB protein
MQTNPYLYYSGNCEAAFKFYAEALGGKILAMITHAETPAAAQTAPEWQQKIIHARIALGDTVLMGSDAPPGRQAPMSGFSVTVNVAEPAEAERVFHALAEGGTIIMPIEETFWAKRFAMLTDRFGTPWMINCEKLPMSA